MAYPSVATRFTFPDGPACDLLAKQCPACIVGVMKYPPSQLVFEFVDRELRVAEFESREEASQVRFASHLPLKSIFRQRRQFVEVDLAVIERARKLRVGYPVSAQLSDSESPGVEMTQGRVEPAFQLRFATTPALQKPIPAQGARRVGWIDRELHLRHFEKAVVPANHHVVDAVDALFFGFDADPFVGVGVTIEFE